MVYWSWNFLKHVSGITDNKNNNLDEEFQVHEQHKSINQITDAWIWVTHMLKRWRKRASSSSLRPMTNGQVPSDVPPGHVAVNVGINGRRFIVRTSYLSHPVFQSLLVQAGEEYGFRTEGPLTIPCDESVFEEALRVAASSESSRTSSFRLGKSSKRTPASSDVGNVHSDQDFMDESGPLLVRDVERTHLQRNPKTRVGRVVNRV
ncbi:hypothetical protein Ancab_018011 [Ancistrocladus abbreviatus]